MAVIGGKPMVFLLLCFLLPLFFFLPPSSSASSSFFKNLKLSSSFQHAAKVQNSQVTEQKQQHPSCGAWQEMEMEEAGCLGTTPKQKPKLCPKRAVTIKLVNSCRVETKSTFANPSDISREDRIIVCTIIFKYMKMT